MSRCKVGDVAEVIGGALNLANIGKHVRVLKFAGEHSKYGTIWHCASEGGELVTEYGAVGHMAHFADDWLRPIPPQTKPPVDVREVAGVEL